MKLSNTSQNNWDTIAYTDTNNISREIEVAVVDKAKGDQRIIGKIDFNTSTIVFEHYETLVDKGCSNKDIDHFVPNRQVTVGRFDTYDRDDFESGVRECFEQMIEDAYGQFWRQEMDYDDIDTIIEQFVTNMRVMVEADMGEHARVLEEGDEL